MWDTPPHSLSGQVAEHGLQCAEIRIARGMRGGCKIVSRAASTSVTGMVSRIRHPGFRW